MREAEISEARGSHCMPLERANSADQAQDLVLSPRARCRSGRRPARRRRPCSSRRGSRSAGRRSPSTSSTPRWARPAAAPTLMAMPTSRPQSRRTRWSSAGWRAPRPVAARRRRPRSRRAARAWHQRCRAAAAESGPRRQTIGWASACGRRSRSSVGDQQHVVGIELLQQGRRSRPGRRRAAAPRRRALRPASGACAATPPADVVAPPPRRARSRARSGAGRGRAPPAGPRSPSSRSGSSTTRGRLAGARRVRSRRRMPSRVATLRKNAVSCAIASNRTGAESTQACTSRWATTVAETGSPVSADSSPKHCGAHQLHPPAAVAQLDPHRALDQPEQLGRGDAGAQDDVAGLEAAHLQVPLELRERRGRHVGEQRVQRQRGCQRYFCQSELLKRPCGSTRDLSWRSCATSG